MLKEQPKETKLKRFRVTPLDLYNFYINGLPFIGRYEKKLIMVALWQAYRRGFSNGADYGVKMTTVKFKDSFNCIDEDGRN